MHFDTLYVTGMQSEDCAEAVMRAFKSIDGVGTVSVSYPSSRAIVQFDEALTAHRQMHAVLERAGYGLRRQQPDGQSCSGRCAECRG